MVVRVTPVRAEIVCFKRRAEDCLPYLALQHFSVLTRRRLIRRAISPTRSRVRVRVQSAFRDVDLTDNVEIAAFP